MRRTLALAGRWYPADTDGLDRMIPPQQEPGGLANGVLPHAGLLYSAPLIAGFFGSLAEGVRTIMILSPSHYYPLKADTLYSYPYDEAETPYGDIEAVPFPLPYRECRDAVDREHGIEMFLPFIGKRKLSVSFALISHLSSGRMAEDIAAELAGRLDGSTAVIASSDFTHYGLRFGYAPYAEEAARHVKEHDQEAARLLASGKAAAAYDEYRNSTICGIAPAAIVSALSRIQGLEGYAGGYYTSADITGEEDDFVSYATVLWRRR